MKSLSVKIVLAILLTIPTGSVFAEKSIFSPRAPGHSDLFHFQNQEGKNLEVKTQSDWKKKRKQILLGMEKAMGVLPPRKDLGLFYESYSNVSIGNGFRRYELSIASGEGDRIYSHLYIPDGLEDKEKRPALLALHPTSPLGKGIVAGYGPLPNRNYGEELAQRGYVVMAPDYPSFGDASDYDFTKDRHASGTMKGIFNHMRCVDFLQNHPNVHPEKIGVIGHSLGGHNAMFLGVFDERVKVIVSSCGWNPFHDYYGGKIKGWTSTRYMPRLESEYHLDPDSVPFDFYEVAAALAPRGFFSISPLRDRNFEVTGIMKTEPRVERVYDLLEASGNFRIQYPNAEHDFPPENRRQSYHFIDRLLGYTPNADQSRIPATGIHPDELSEHFTGPWDDTDLFALPEAVWGNQTGQVREVYYEGVPFKGKPSRIFAYYAHPDILNEPVPAMVLLHGGGGKAFRVWAELWANRGYAALAMDLSGRGADGNRLMNGGPEQSDEGKFGEFTMDTAKEMWTYHAVAAATRGHSLLASLDEVDGSRIGITGISWGGYLTGIVSGLDHRLKVSVPVYGCGFLHQNSVWLPRFNTMPPKQRDLWVSCFDPSIYLSGIQCPILWVNGTNDFAYPMDSYQKSYDMVPGEVNLCLRVNMPHGHPQGWNPMEIGRFVDSHLKEDRSFPQISEMKVEKNTVTSIIESQLKIKEGSLHFTKNKGPWQHRKWQTSPAVLDGNTVVAHLPDERPIVVYLSITDDQGALVSTPHQIIL